MNHMQQLVRSAALLLMALGGQALMGSGLAVAQAVYPNKPLRLVVTFPTGGAPDILARLFSEKAQLGQSVVVDNKPGAATTIAVAEVARAPADGYTLYFGGSGAYATTPVTLPSPNCPMKRWMLSMPRSWASP